MISICTTCLGSPCRCSSPTIREVVATLTSAAGALLQLARALSNGMPRSVAVRREIASQLCDVAESTNRIGHLLLDGGAS